VSLESDIIAAIGPLVANRVYPDVAPLNVAIPYITYSRVGGVPTNTLAGDSNGQNARIQFNFWHTRRSEVNDLAKAVKGVLTETPFFAVSLGEPVAEFNAVTKDRGARQDFSFWRMS
jgi:hypothetical protein